MKPTFLVIGAAKAGTSTLVHQLRQHPEIFMSPKKELHFFSFDPTYAKGVQWYESWFQDCAGRRHVGEASTSYTVRKVFPHAAERMAAYAPDLRLIYIVRHPLERMESLWLQLRRLGVAPFSRVGMTSVPPQMRVDLSFNKAIRLQADALLESTNYWREINVYRQHFADEQILVLLFEELRGDQQRALRRCFEFLGVDPTVQLHGSAHLNSMDEYRLPRSLLWRLWSSPRLTKLYTAVGGALPEWVRAPLRRRFLLAPVKARPRWDADTRAWAWGQLQNDVRKFLEFYGYDPGIWAPPS